MYNTDLVKKVDNKSWLTTNVIYSSHPPLLPNIKTFIDNCGFGPPATGIPEGYNFNLIVEVGTPDDWEPVADRIVSISTDAGVGSKTKFPNCTELIIRRECDSETLDLARFPSLTALDCRHDDASSLKVVGDTSKLKEVALCSNSVHNLREVTTTVVNTSAGWKCDRVKRMFEISIVGSVVALPQFTNLVELSGYCVDSKYLPRANIILSQLHNLKILTLRFSFHFRHNRNPFESIPYLPNLEQLSMRTSIVRVSLPPRLMKMTKLNRLAIDASISNYPFIPQRLFFISELRVHQSTKTALVPLLCNTWYPRISLYCDTAT